MASLAPPTYRAQNGAVYVGRVLSADEVTPLETALRDAGGDWYKTKLALRAVTKAYFPRDWRRPWRRTVWSWIKRLPPIGQMAAVWDFMQSQASALGVTLPLPPGIKRLLDAQGEQASVSRTAGS